MEEETKPPVKQINLEYFPWIMGVIPNLTPHNRIETYNAAKRILNDFTPNFCNCKNENVRVTINSATPETTIAILNRVGEKSRAGIIYRIQIGDILAALKVMPITEENHVNKNKKETKIANLLSEHVVNNTCKFFPLVYGNYDCEDILYPIDSEFLGDALKYAISRKANEILETTLHDFLNELDGIKEEEILRRTVRLAIRNVKKIPSFLKNNTYTGIESTSVFLNDMAREVNRIFEISGIKYVDTTEEELKPKLEGNLLISELANGDIISYSKYLINKSEKLSNNYWFEILEGVLEGIKVMQSDNIIHNDLHPGNVLILIKKTEIIPLIHDFGESEIINVNERETWNLEKRSTDIKHFLDTILKTELIIDNGTAHITDAMSDEFKKFTIDYLKLVDDLSKNHETNQETYMELIINKFNEMKTIFFQSNPSQAPTPPPVPPIKPLEELVSTPRGGNRRTHSKNKAKTRKPYKKNNKKTTKKRRMYSKKKRGSRR